MGKGLDIQSKGCHIAFTGGTGCLVFLDLVAYLLKLNTGIPLSQKKPAFDTSFKFVLYVSFQSREESIALELCEGLKKVCEQKSINNFEFHARFSNESKAHWNKEFVLNQLKNYQPLSKVWVCGPPIMNEEFDKILEKDGMTFGIDRHNYEIY